MPKDMSIHFVPQPVQPQPGPTLSVVIPMLNEEGGIARLFEVLPPALDALGVDWEVVCVDDGSTDRTLHLLREVNRRLPQVRVVSLSRNFGKDLALAAGLSHARGRAVVPLDADLQHPVELIGRFLELWREGYEVVYAYRARRDDEGAAKRLLSNAYYGLVSRISDPVIPPHTADFRLMDRRVVDTLNAMPERGRFMKGLCAWTGFRQIGVPYMPAARHAGGSRWSLWKLWNFALDGLTAFSTMPLRVWTYVGLAVSLLAFAVGLYELVETLAFGVVVPGYASIIVSVLFLGGLQLIATGILGEYLARIFTEVKGRPLFVVKECVGFAPEAIQVQAGAVQAGAAAPAALVPANTAATASARAAAV
ncbi:MAG TPA: glycosyltransferase family 2 protein [Azospirillaceae bacterium]|nr:glycosyltransferase family 2 protein [Azospirillaceae bacterium]